MSIFAFETSAGLAKVASALSESGPKSTLRPGFHVKLLERSDGLDGRNPLLDGVQEQERPHHSVPDGAQPLRNVDFAFFRRMDHDAELSRNNL